MLETSTFLKTVETTSTNAVFIYQIKSEEQVASPQASIIQNAIHAVNNKIMSDYYELLYGRQVES